MLIDLFGFQPPFEQSDVFCCACVVPFPPVRGKLARNNM